MATASTTTTTSASALGQLTALLGTHGVQLGKLAILSPEPVSVVTPNLAAIVSAKAILVNRGKQLRLVTASSINPLASNTTPTTKEGYTWGPATLAPGAMTVLPAPGSDLAWFVVDVTQRQLSDLAWTEWLLTGFAVLGAGAGTYLVIKDVREHLAKRRQRRARR